MRHETPQHRTGCVIGDRLIILDRRASRYFMVEHDAQTAASVPVPPDGHAEVLSWDQDRLPRRDTARATWVILPRTAVAAGEFAGGTLALTRLWMGERTAARRLRAGLLAGLEMLDVGERGDASSIAQQSMIEAAWQSLRLWSAEDRCLPRSIALLRLLRRVGSEAKLVIGVTARPFTAHAWVQQHDVVLNDTLDHAALFTPIFVA